MDITNNNERKKSAFDFMLRADFYDVAFDSAIC